MEEKDRNYVLRLECEGKLAASEPNLKTEVPKLYVEVLAERTKNMALMGDYLRATESTERDYLAAKERWLAAELFRETCGTYWQTYYEANYGNGQKQADAKCVLNQCKTEMQKAKATTKEPEARMQAALAAKQKTEQVAVNQIEQFMCKRS